MNVFKDLSIMVHKELEHMTNAGELPRGLDLGALVVEPPRDPAHGDVATNAALTLARPAGRKPRDIAEPLARRLARHATRSGRRPPHRIRKAMVIAALGLDGVDLLPRGEKRLHWHIDYLLDQRSVSLKRVVAIRSPVRLESAVADLLFADPHTAVIETGLGASDAPGSTHLLRVDNDAGWWEGLVKCLEVLLKRQETEEA